MWALIFFSCLLPSLQYVALEEIHPEDGSQPFSSSSSLKETEDPVTIPAETCSPEKSLFSKKDIRTMIDYVADSMLIYESITKSYFAQAIAVRNKHMDDLKSFLVWFQNRPEHLKHVLKDFTFLKNHIEQYVRKVANVLDEYSQLKEGYEKQLKRTNELSETTKRYNMICQNNCIIKSFSPINDKSGNDYCSSLEDLHKTIKSKLLMFAQYLISDIQKKLTCDDNLYAEEIGELQNNLKDVALKEFGRTMYDILTLSDEYHNFIQNVFGNNVESEVNNIKDLSSLINSELSELEFRVEKYGDYCRTCNIDPRNAFLNNIEASIIDKKQVKSMNIVDDLLNIKYKEIETAVQNDYMIIFEELESLLNNTDPNTIYASDLKPIQDEVVELLKKSKAELNELKSIIPEWSINNLFNLLSDSEQLLLHIKSKNSDLINFSS